MTIILSIYYVKELNLGKINMVIIQVACETTQTLSHGEYKN